MRFNIACPFEADAAAKWAAARMHWGPDSIAGASKRADLALTGPARGTMLDFSGETRYQGDVESTEGGCPSAGSWAEALGRGGGALQPSL